MHLPNDTGIMPCPNQSQHCIQALGPHEGMQYLGVYVTCSSTTKPMEDHIWHKAVTYMHAFQQTHMSRREAGVLYKSCFLLALTYSFPAMGLPSVFLDHIHSLSTATILNKMGYHHNLPQSLIFAPHCLGGIGLCNFIYEQSAQQTIILLRHLHARTPLGTAMETLICTYQLCAGLCFHILIDTQPCTWVSNQWLTHLQNSMRLYHLQISYAAWMIPPL